MTSKLLGNDNKAKSSASYKHLKKRRKSKRPRYSPKTKPSNLNDVATRDATYLLKKQFALTLN